MCATVPLVVFTLLLAFAIIVTGVVLVVRGVIEMRRSARQALITPLGQRTTTGVAMVVIGAVLIGTLLAFMVFTIIAAGNILNN